MGQDNANEVDVALVRLPTSAQCLKDDVEQEDTHASYKASPAPKQWAARKGAVDAEESWAVEKEWGLQHGFRESQLGEIENVLDLMVGKTIPSQNITGCVELDRGSFGEIFSATLHQDGPPPITVRVAVKRVDQHSTPEGTTMPQVFRYVHLEMAVASVLEHPNVPSPPPHIRDLQLSLSTRKMLWQPHAPTMTRQSARLTRSPRAGG
ncbi:hypothetical protein T484DRAFT_3179691 [Baffinella frigidus]|nr:hypothetical protein T484DRAFT_3179691 [Cryptophyta sp. CCMP2293]